MMSRVEPVGAVVRSGADSPSLLGQINDQIVLGLLLQHGPMTRAQIGEHTGLSKPTVSALVDRLHQRHLIEEAGRVTGGPGPKARKYRVDATAAYVVGLHVEQRGTIAQVASLTGSIIATHTVTVPHRRDSDPLGEASQAVDGVLAEAKLSRDHVDQIVVATPGVIDPISGALRHARHLVGWERPGLRDAIAERLGIPVSHGNDINLAAVAEGLSGAAQGHKDYALLWLGRGVGLGLVFDGRLRTGAHGGAGEIGYLPAHGLAELPRVDRGSAGSFQQLVGGQGLKKLARDHGIRGGDPVSIIEAALDGGEAGSALLATLAERIAIGVASITALTDPGLIVLGGPIAMTAGHRLVERVTADLPRVSFVKSPVVLSEVAEHAVLTGAIEVALRDVRSRLFGTPIAHLVG